MKSRFLRLKAVALSAVLATSLGACAGQGDNQNSQADNDDVTQAEPIDSSQVAPDAGGRIDVTATGATVATFDGPKYIVSDATVGQTQQGDYGLQEACVVVKPESWANVDSLGWDRNSITFNGVSTPWGTATIRYEYINEAGSGAEQQEWSRTTEEGFFGSDSDVSHATVSNHQVAYVFNADAANEIAPGIHDLEAQDNPQLPQSTVISLYGWEPRADNCAFAVTVKCEMDEERQGGVTAEELLEGVYAPIEFAEPDRIGDAAAFESDVTLTNTSGNRKVIVHRNGTDLLSYTAHAVSLTGIANAPAYAQLRIDYAPEGSEDSMEEMSASTSSFDEAAGYTDVEVSEVEDCELEGRAFHLRTIQATMEMGDQGPQVTREVRAWCDVDGDVLYVRATMLEGEDAQAALERYLAGRLEFVS